MVYVGVALLVLCVVLLVVRRSKESKLLAMSSTETSTAQGLVDAAKYVAERLGESGSFNQVTEVKGIVKCGSPLISEVAKQQCVYYEMRVTRKYEEEYWETDSQSKQQVRKTREQSETVASNSQWAPFWVEDATGRTLVNAAGADVDCLKVVDKFEPYGSLGGGTTLSYGNFSLDLGGLLNNLGGSRTIGYHIEERLLPLERQVYVLGEARDSSGELAIEKPREKGKKFMISVKSEEELISSVTSTVRWLLVSAVASGIAGVGLIVVGRFR